MALYTYTCKTCGWTGDRTAKIAERDNQKCTVVALATTTGDDSNYEYPVECGGELAREEITLTARMSHFWQV